MATHAVAAMFTTKAWITPPAKSNGGSRGLGVVGVISSRWIWLLSPVSAKTMRMLSMPLTVISGAIISISECARIGRGSQSRLSLGLPHALNNALLPRSSPRPPLAKRSWMRTELRKPSRNSRATKRRPCVWQAFAGAATATN